MKSAYEIAMARLEADKGPGKTLTDAQKATIAEIGKRFEAKIAQARFEYEQQLAAAPPQEQPALQAELAGTIARLESECEREKDAVRDGA